MADQLPTTASTSTPSALGREAGHVALNRSHAELHSVALAPDHTLGSQLDSDAVDFGCVRENVIHAARDGQHEMVAIVETAQGSMKATSGHGPAAVGDVVHCTAECGTSSASSVAADQLLTAAMDQAEPIQSAYSDGPVWNAFGLTRAAYLVVPRRTLQSMPLEWQERFVALMHEAHAHLPAEAFPDYTVQRQERGRFITDPLRDYRHTGPIPPKENRDEP
ncbi:MULTISPECIES: hypothetical protein [Stenotrophomonas]|uniref:hypothetical protein n=1 Tax=Stenotrophomonas TaxID=40323 RepID=UPI0022EA7E25|nr:MULTISPECIES: hypothetical protein [Stenotrophomonas]MDA3306124.1 hypothetical protein [Stenotrophomonas sp. PI_27]WGS56340.1 hypothetical protein IAI57_15795 [Stenotrophomonas pavanii]